VDQTTLNPAQPLYQAAAGLTEHAVAHRESGASRIDGYDISRAIAVFGMLVVNYHSILLQWHDGESLFVDLAEFTCGRAAALFITLAGVGLTLMFRRAITSGNREMLTLARRSVWKRCLVLYLSGLLFLQFWRVDILHFYGLFLFIGAQAVNASARSLWRLILVIFLLATTLYCLTGGDPDLSYTLPTHIFNPLNDLLFNGPYSAFPWIIFLLTGIWFGNTMVLGNRHSNAKIILWTLLIFSASEILLRLGDLAYPDEADTLPALLLGRQAFPISPSFTISAASGALLMITFTMNVCRSPRIFRLIKPLKDVGRLSLTIYISHILLAYWFHDLVRGRYTDEAYLNVVLLFAAASTLFFVIFAHFWCRCFARGPLEWLLRQAATVGVKKGSNDLVRPAPF